MPVLLRTALARSRRITLPRTPLNKASWSGLPSQPPRRLRHGDASVRGAHQGLREHEEVPPGLPRFAVHPGAQGAGAGWALGGGRDQRLRWRAGIRHGDDPGAQRREDMARQALLWGAFRGTRVESRVGRAGGVLRLTLTPTS